MLEFRFRHKDGTYRWIYNKASSLKNNEGKIIRMFGTHTDITERKKAEQELKRLEWLLTERPKVHNPQNHEYNQSYGNLVSLNTNRLILDSVGEKLLNDIVGDYLNLLDSSSAVYEKNGDYALGIFSSGWCRFMDAASRAMCNTNDNHKALTCGLWHCHESCWTHASKKAIETGQPTDIECNGGIRLYALPIKVGDEIVGAINFGYGEPPRDEKKLRELATSYMVSYDDLRTHALNYESRPPYIIELAKHRLGASARLIGEIIERKKAEESLKRTKKLLSESEQIGKVGGWEFNVDTLELNWTEETFRIHEVDLNYNHTVESGINFYTPDSKPIIENALKRAIEFKEPFDLEL